MREAGYDIKDWEKGHQITQEEFEVRNKEYMDCITAIDDVRKQEDTLNEQDQKDLSRILDSLDDNCKTEYTEWLKKDKND